MIRPCSRIISSSPSRTRERVVDDGDLVVQGVLFGLFKPYALDAPRAPSLPRVLEVLQVRRLLLLFHGHQVAVRADVVVFFADLDVAVILRAIVFEPDRAFLAA